MVLQIQTTIVQLLRDLEVNPAALAAWMVTKAKVWGLGCGVPQIRCARHMVRRVDGIEESLRCCVYSGLCYGLLFRKTSSHNVE